MSTIGLHSHGANPVWFESTWQSGRNKDPLLFHGPNLPREGDFNPAPYVADGIFDQPAPTGGSDDPFATTWT